MIGGEEGAEFFSSKGCGKRGGGKCGVQFFALEWGPLYKKEELVLLFDGSAHF